MVGEVDSELPARIRGKLKVQALRMAAGQDSWPVQLKPVCENLGISVVRRADIDPGKAYLSWDRDKDVSPTVLLPRANLSVWDRFCIAHELGHFVLISRYDWLPAGKSAYWKTEALCDQFARDLLMPTPLVERIGAAKWSSAREAMEACHLLSRSAAVPWIHAGKTLSQRYSDVALMYLKRDASGFKVTATTSLAGDRGRFMKVGKSSEFAVVAAECIDEAQRNFSLVGRQLGRDVFNGTTLGTLFGELRVTDIFLQASSFLRDANRTDLLKIAALKSSRSRA